MDHLTVDNIKDSTTLRLWQLIEEHLEDQEFNTSCLLKAAAMSRSSLHRKLTEKAGMSASCFIRIVRLANGRKMLADIKGARIKTA